MKMCVLTPTALHTIFFSLFASLFVALSWVESTLRQTRQILDPKLQYVIIL
jgi:hypothetical protein